MDLKQVTSSLMSKSSLGFVGCVCPHECDKMTSGTGTDLFTILFVKYIPNLILPFLNYQAPK